MNLQVEKKGEGVYQVTVSERGGSTSHTVRVPPAYAQKLTGGRVPEEQLLRRSFEFLLAREPKESILAEFELSVIARYFPEYEREIQKLLD